MRRERDVTDDASFLVSRTAESEKQVTKRWPRAAIGFFFTLIVASVFFFVTNNGIVKVEVNDESFQATIDGQVVTVKEDGKSQPIKLRAGDHKLVVKAGGVELVTSEFEISRNEEIKLRVELLQGSVIVRRDGKQVSSKLMPETPRSGFVGAETVGSSRQVAEASTNSEQKTLADLSGDDFTVIYEQITGIAPGYTKGSQQLDSSYGQSLNILLDMQPGARDRVAKALVESGKPEIAKIVLSDGRVDPEAGDAVKLGDLLVNSGEGRKAVEAYLEGFRIAPHLFRYEHIKTFVEQNRLSDLAELFTEERLSKTRGGSQQQALLEKLLKDETGKSQGMQFMNRLWKARPDVRGLIVRDIPWGEVPNRLDYFRPLLIPSDVEAVGVGWGHLFGGDVHGGWLRDVGGFLNANK